MQNRSKIITKLSCILTVILLITGCTPSGNSGGNVPVYTSVAPLATFTTIPTERPTLEMVNTQSEPQTPFSEPTSTEPVPSLKGIILFIGDGMGSSQVMAARWFLADPDGSLVMEDLDVQGMVITDSLNKITGEVTDSAAAATAMASGEKTYNSSLGLDISFERVPTILELAKEQGWATGLVTTAEITSATPAAFASHTVSREYTVEIARQLLFGGHGGVDLLLGAGEDDFLPWTSEGCYPGGGNRGDGRNLIQEAREAGYTVVCTAQEFAAVDLNETDQVLGLFGAEGINSPFQPSLAEMTATAVEILSRDEEGFFLMVEGGQIDWAGHANNGMALLENMTDFDAAVKVGADLVLENPGVQLIVTADHETGDLELGLGKVNGKGDGPYEMLNGTPFYLFWGSGSHTAKLVPVFATGPYTESLRGENENIEIFEVMFRMLEDDGG